MSIYRKKSLPEILEDSTREQGSNLSKNNIELILDLLSMIFWIIILKYINDLEKYCNCSYNWKRDFIKYSLIIFVIFLLLKIVFRKKLFSNINNNIIFLIVLLNVVFTIIVAIYINELKNIECKCSESNIRMIFEIINYIRLFIIILCLLAGAYLYYTNSRKHY